MLNTAMVLTTLAMLHGYLQGNAGAGAQLLDHVAEVRQDAVVDFEELGCLCLAELEHAYGGDLEPRVVDLFHDLTEGPALDGVRPASIDGDSGRPPEARQRTRKAL